MDPTQDRSSSEMVDPVLLPFLRAADETESQERVERLISEVAAPVIEKVLSRKLRLNFTFTGRNWSNHEASDIYGESVVRLLTRLQDLKIDTQSKPISNFRAYVAVTTYHAVDEYLRQKYPQRHRLKNKIRYALNHHPELTLWESNTGDWLCGLEARADRLSALRASNRLDQLHADPRRLKEAGFSNRNPSEMPLTDLLLSVLKWVGHPVELDHMVSFAAHLLGINDKLDQIEEGEAIAATSILPTADEQMHRRAYLRRLWMEICGLPVRQRAALLMNLKDGQGNNAAALFPLEGIATTRQIAEALSISAEQLAEIWNELPIDDKKIAAHLGVTRQQVINLRKSARARLARRMKHF
jgi:DNA-directed RNA polymerase specialized sigma24 family protein